MKKIAIVGWNQGTNGFGIGKSYADFILHFGAMPLIIGPSVDKEYHDSVIKEADMLLLPGGPDLSPSEYGEAPNLYTGQPDIFKESFFRNNLKHYIGKVPTFGICLGFQMLNVFFGGKLEQHLYTGALHQSANRWTKAHEVLDIDTNKVFDVNSHHHQAVSPRILAKSLKPQVVSMRSDKAILHKSMNENNTLIEAFRHKELPVAGVQWHPEEYYDDHSVGMVSELLELKNKEVVWK
jgi:putative glutamine amidotransferase